MTVRDTTLKAWDEMQEHLPRSRKIIYEAIGEDANRQPTRLELEKMLRQQYPSLQLTPRIKELRDMGLIVEVEKRPCSISRKLAWTLRVTTRREYEAFQKQSRPVMKHCPNCNGTGKLISYHAGGSNGH